MNDQIKVDFQQIFESKIALFREMNKYIDVNFIQKDGKIIRAHKIILTKYSNIFHDFFESNHELSNVINIPVFFDPNSTFHFLIDFFYSQEISIPPKLRSELYALAVVYEVESLELIMKSQILKSLSFSNVFQYSQSFSKMTINPDAKTQLPKLYQNFQQLYLKLDFLTKYIGENIKIFPTQSLFSSLSPTLFYSTVYYSKLSDFERVSIIDSYLLFLKYHCTPEESKMFETLINWNSPDVLRFFLANSLDWLTQSTARKLINEILLHRRKSIKKFFKEVKNSSIYHTSSLPFVPAKTTTENMVSNWWTFQWLTEISQSNGKGLSEIEVSKYAITLGETTHWCGMEFGILFRPDCSPSIEETDHPLPEEIDNFSWVNMFDDSKSYFKSVYQKGHLPYIGVSFVSCRFLLSKIAFHCNFPSCKRPDRLCLEAITTIGKPAEELGSFAVKDETCFFNLSKSVPVYAIRLKSSKYQRIHILRCTRLQLYGVFVS